MPAIMGDRKSEKLNIEGLQCPKFQTSLYIGSVAYVALLQRHSHDRECPKIWSLTVHCQSRKCSDPKILLCVNYQSMIALSNDLLLLYHDTVMHKEQASVLNGCMEKVNSHSVYELGVKLGVLHTSAECGRYIYGYI